MHYREFPPNNLLLPYVQCYFTCETETAVVAEDSVFATGFVEIMFNLGTDGPEQIVSGGVVHEPAMQLWGQTIRPFTFASFRKHTMLGVRFFPHTAACFFNEPIALFNDQVIDLHDVAGKAAGLLYAQLMEAGSLAQRIALVERFLLGRLSLFEHKFRKLQLVGNILQAMGHDDFFENIHSIAASYGITSRYLQKLFVSYSGLSPGLFSKIARFQRSLQLLTEKDMSLTTIAYQCGYYDQSHFIKDFRSFTGTAPSHFQPELSTDLLVPMNN
ncbi:MAG: AraC family transcriptional regulator [Mucilaginibacter sp.]